MQIPLSILMVLLTIHFFLLIWTNKWRIRKLVTFIDKFKQEELLGKRDYEYLNDRYTNFFRYMEFFPDKEDYRLLYENKDFYKFVTTTKTRLKYYAIVSVICATLLAVLVPISEKG
jgi:hypothetical protein